MNNTTEQRYLVFLKAEFLCDAMGYIAGAVPHGADASLFDDECDGNWRSVSGPVLLMDKTCADMDELKSSILDNYPGIDFEVLDIYQNLFELNLEGAEEEYLEEYEDNYSPDTVFPEAPTKEAVVTGLGSLIAELINDTGDSSLVDGWIEQAADDDTGFHEEFLKAVAELREMRVR